MRCAASAAMRSTFRWPRWPRSRSAFVAFAMPADLLAEPGRRDRPAVASSRRRAAARHHRADRDRRRRRRSRRSAWSSMLLRLLDRSMLGSSRPRTAPVRDDAPRLRRRDAHPDAPAPRPISAARDLGEPVAAGAAGSRCAGLAGRARAGRAGGVERGRARSARAGPPSRPQAAAEPAARAGRASRAALPS